MAPVSPRVMITWCSLFVCYVRFSATYWLRAIWRPPPEQVLRALVQMRLLFEALGPEANLAGLVRRNWVLLQTFNKGAGIILRLWKSDESGRAYLSRFRNLAAYETARAAGKGVILANFHTMNHANAVYELSRRHDGLNVILADPDVLERLPQRVRTSRLRFWDARDPHLLRKLSRRLRAGEIVVIYPDFSLGRRDSEEGGVPVRVLGHTVRVRAGAAMLSLLSGAPIVPVVNVSRALYWNEICFGEPIVPDRSAPREGMTAQTMQKLMAFLEPFVLRRPESWMMWKMLVPGFLSEYAEAAPAGRCAKPRRILASPRRRTSTIVRSGRRRDERLFVQLDPFLALKVDRLGEAMIRLHQCGLAGPAIRAKIERRFRVPPEQVERRFRALFPSGPEAA